MPHFRCQEPVLHLCLDLKATQESLVYKQLYDLDISLTPAHSTCIRPRHSYISLLVCKSCVSELVTLTRTYFPQLRHPGPSRMAEHIEEQAFLPNEQAHDPIPSGCIL